MLKRAALMFQWTSRTRDRVISLPELKCAILHDPSLVVMSSSESQQHTFPVVPPSLSAGGHEMRDYYDGQDAPRPTTNQSPYHTPYMGLQARLSQVWINRWTILLLLVLVRVLLACSGLDENLASAKREALSSCSSVETRGNDLLSMPHYMSKGVNELTAHGVEKAVNGLMSMSLLSITAVEEIVLFIINLMTSTYVCLITLAIGGSLHVAVNVIADVTDFLNKTLGEISDGLQGVVSDFESSLDDFIDGINSLPFTGDDTIPKPDLGGIEHRLNNVQLPSSIDQGLREFNKSIPNFHQVHEFTDHAIKLPFEKLKGLINEAMGKYHFDRSLFPVLERSHLTFCSTNDGIRNFFDGLIETEQIARKVFIGVILVLAILACVPMAWYEIKRWRTMRERAALVNQQAFDPMDVVYIASRPHTASVGIKIADRFQSVRHRTLVRWAVAYATSTPALFVLALGVAGLFACLCQYILLKQIEKEVPVLANEVGDFADTVVRQLNNLSTQWQQGANQAIHQTNQDINQQLFGWVRESTDAVNHTLNVFVDEMMGSLRDVFGGTILFDPIKEVLNCLILLKIRGIEDGLTWVHDHAHIEFPDLPDGVFTIGAADSIHKDSSNDSFLAQPGSGAQDEITGIVDRLVDLLSQGIYQEAIISLCVVLVWVIVALIGLIRTIVLMWRPGRGRAEGGQAYADDPATSGFRGQDYPRPMSVAPPYEANVRSVPYTITARPFPTAGPSNNVEASDPDEQIKKVGAHQVGGSVTQPMHLRASSHGALGGASPRDEKNPADFPVEYHR